MLQRLLKDLEINKEVIKELEHIYATEALPQADEDSSTYEGPTHDPAVTGQSA